MNHHIFLVDFLDSVWANSNPDAATAYFAPDARIDGLGSDESLTPQDLVTFAGAILLLIHPPRWEVARVVAKDDWASYLIRGHAVSRSSGNDVTITGQVMLRFQDDLIAEAYNNFDMIGVFTELGVLPDDLLEQALAGTMAA